MEHPTYEAVIGLEVHVQLRTQTKAFSPESAAFGAPPNTHIDPISLAHPGTLPVLNRTVVEYAVQLGLATQCTIAPRSIMARKHYFYADLPKGYQISQYATPICSNGHLDLVLDDETGTSATRRIGITRIHIEEDAGKSIHDQDPYDSLIDVNRCGVPLLEIVSEPDLRSPREAMIYMQQIRQIVRYLDICDGNMEEGSLRCDANISIRPVGTTALGTKTEVKNLNSFRHVERAIAFEIERQRATRLRGEAIVQETVLWDPHREETRPMRSKEEAHDYRYFPDPDLVPITVSAEQRETLRMTLPELPETRRQRFIQDLGLPAYDATVLTEERPVADYFEATLSALVPATSSAEATKHVSNFVMGDVLRTLNETQHTLTDFPILPDRLAGLIALRLENQINSSAAQTIFDTMLTDSATAMDIATRQNLLQVSNTEALRPVIAELVAAHPNQVAQYRNGKTGLIGFFIGQVMRNFPGSPDPQVVRELLIDALDPS